MKAVNNTVDFLPWGRILNQIPIYKVAGTIHVPKLWLRVDDRITNPVLEPLAAHLEMEVDDVRVRPVMHRLTEHLGG